MLVWCGTLLDVTQPFLFRVKGKGIISLEIP